MEGNQVEVKPEPKIKLEKLRLLCRKCGTEWTEDRMLGYLVRYEKDNNYLVDRDNPEKKEYFECPKCESRSEIARLSVKQMMR